MKGLLIMGIVILMGVSSVSLNNVKNSEDNSISTAESVGAGAAETKETKDAGFNSQTEKQNINEEEQTTAMDDKDVIECKEVLTEEFFEDVVSVKSADRWRPISEQKDIDKLKNILWTFKLKEGKKPSLKDMLFGGKSFDFKYKDGTEINVSVSGVMMVYNDVWYDIVNWNEIGSKFYDEVALLYPEEKGNYGEGVFNCQELLSEEFFKSVKEVNYSNGKNTLKSEKELEKFKKKMWLFKVKKSEETDSGSSNSMVFNIKSEDGSKKQVTINEESMVIDGECYDIVNYYEVLIMFLEGIDELFPVED